jgi:hypothetical protein
MRQQNIRDGRRGVFRGLEDGFETSRRHINHEGTAEFGVVDEVPIGLGWTG